MDLEYSLSTRRIEEESVDAIVVSVSEKTLSPEAKRIDAKLGGEISRAIARKEYEGKNGALMVIRTLGKLKQKRVIVIGLGSEKEYGKNPNDVLNAAAAAFGVVKNYDESIAMRISAKDLKLVLQACELSSYDFQEFKSSEETGKRPVKLKRVVFVFENASEKARAEKELAWAKLVARAQNYARVLNNINPIETTPAFMAEQARKLAGGKLKVTVWSAKDLEKKGYNAIISVGKGSVNEPKMAVMEYKGAGSEKPFVFVGKGVCFDTGGVSLKPAAYMDFMQYDKSGACTVIATMKAVKESNLKVNVIGIAPFVENMPSGSAYKPGDIVKTASGKTVEITNTDAEGRVILSDALYHATTFKPKGIIDLATLTGACVVALGHAASGLMTNNDAFANKVKKAAEDSGERVWELPMWNEYAELVKSNVADISNADKSHAAGTIEGAWFLKNFVGDYPWVHLDIAGTAYVEKPSMLFRAGATGWGVRLLLELSKSESK